MPLVSRQVIDAMRNQFAFTGTGKIMIQCIHGCLCIGATFPTKIADEFLLFGINANHRFDVSTLFRTQG